MVSHNSRQSISPVTQKIYTFICDYIRQHKRSPTLREVGDGCFISHTSVLRHLDKLEGMGWLEREPYMPRSLRLGEFAPDDIPDEADDSEPL